MNNYSINTMKKNILSVFILLLASMATYSQETINVFQSKAPGSENWEYPEKELKDPRSGNKITFNVSTPTLSIYLPEKSKATGTAMLIAPGGAFHILSMDSEGHEVAKMLQAKGVAAFVLKYRTVKLISEDPMQELFKKMSDFKKLDEENAPIVSLAIEDAKEALQIIRNNSEKYDIDPKKVGMMGFSAGGTLTLGTFYASPEAAKPNFIAPIYPYVPAVDYLKNIPKTPTPIFIAAASDDQLGFVPANTQLYLEWKAANNPAELHVYEKGGHGFGMNKQKIPTDTWHERLIEWMKMHGYLTKKYPNQWEKGLTEDQIAENNRKNEERIRRDWTNLGRYRDANTKLVPAKNGKPRVVFTGDSITDGWVGASPDFFESNNYIGRGISGQTSPQTLLRFRQDVIDLNPKAVVINIGINDIAENTGDYMPEFTLGNYKSMIEIAKANNIKVVLASVMPAYEFPWRKEIKDIPSKVIALNNGIKALATQHKLVYLDYFNVLKDERNGLSKEMAGDGVHPTKACYAIMEKLAKEAVSKALSK
jgi:acetyl esterase/lipase/lysophospholipase L1-like esterase